MTISIELIQDGLQTGLGTKVFNDKGDEIKNITSINISIQPDDVVMATVEVAIGSLDGMGDIHAMLGTETLKQIASLHGYDLVSRSVLGNGHCVTKIKG